MMSRDPRNSRREPDKPGVIYFDPSKPDTELFDTLAEKQANDLGKINSTQLRKFFSEIKDLYRQFESLTAGLDDTDFEDIYVSKIEPRFKMIRSKVAYASRSGGQSNIPTDFAAVLSNGIKKVDPRKHKDFKRFVMHLEAVVGFMYGSGKVRK